MNILIVEDDERIADFLCRGLRAEGYRVQRAADGPTGLALAQDAARLLQDGGEPTLLLLTPGHAQRQVRRLPAGLRSQALPWLTQNDYDRLLWACDLNFVRGEDSLVRAIWAGAPFVWQAYPQHDGAHLTKLEALLANAQLPPTVEATFRAWNQGGKLPWPPLALDTAWQGAMQAWRGRLQEQTDLASQLLAFAVSKLRPAGSC